MMALLLCGLLLLSPADTVPVATPPPTEAEDVIEAVDLAPWDDLFSRMEDGEAWQRPSALVRSIAAGEEDPARLLAWLKELGLSGAQGRTRLKRLSCSKAYVGQQTCGVKSWNG